MVQADDAASPELKSLYLFVKQNIGDVEKAQESSLLDLNFDDGDLLPEQIPSIINESATVRYYRDAIKKPMIISDGHQGTVTAANGIDDDSEVFDVRLCLDVTTGCGGKVWPAAEVLGQYIASKRSDDQWKGKIILELGAGTGLVGLLAAKSTKLGKIWITDQIPMMALMQRNLALNQDLCERCIIAELNWGEAIHKDIPSMPDVLLLADCVYLEVAFQPLVNTMKALSTAKTEILFCYQQRRKADKRFFKMLRKHFTFQDIDDDDPIRTQEYNRQGTRLYKVCKIKD